MLSNPFISLSIITYMVILTLQPDKLISDLGGAMGLWVGFSVLTILEFLEFFIDCLVIGFMKTCGRSESMKRTSSEEKVPLDDKTMVNASVISPGAATQRKYPANIMARNMKRIGNKVYRTNPIKAYKLKGKTGWKAPKKGKVTPQHDSRFDPNPETPDLSGAYYHRSRMSTGIGEYGRGIMTPTDVDPRILARQKIF